MEVGVWRCGGVECGGVEERRCGVWRCGGEEVWRSGMQRRALTFAVFRLAFFLLRHYLTFALTSQAAQLFSPPWHGCRQKCMVCVIEWSGQDTTAALSPTRVGGWGEVVGLLWLPRWA